MWPFRRKRKSARKDLKQVYYYKEDFITLKAWSKQAKMSMTRLAHDILQVYLGYKYGDLTGENKRLELHLDLLASDYKRIRDELTLYKERFGQIVA